MAIQIILDKTCRKCGSNKWYPSVRNNAPRYDCADCKRKLNKKWCDNNKETISATNRRYYNNSDKAKKLIKKREWNKKNPDKVKEMWKRYHEKAVKSLSDSYIKHSIQRKGFPRIPFDQIPEQLIIEVRAYLKVKRLIILKTKENELSRINR